MLIFESSKVPLNVLYHTFVDPSTGCAAYGRLRCRLRSHFFECECEINPMSNVVDKTKLHTHYRLPGSDSRHTE
jgi:hypothetical protein